MRFSPWERFENREKLRGFRFPGIYALAISSRNIAGTPFGYVKEIVYFGMTNSRVGLRGRLNAFNNTLRDKSGPGHGGAERFRYDYEDGEILSRKLYVAICPFECDVTSIDRKDLEAMGTAHTRGQCHRRHTDFRQAGVHGTLWSTLEGSAKPLPKYRSPAADFSSS